MPVISRNGLLHGDRLQTLSLMAYLYWPFFFVASNGYGRFEIAYHLILCHLGKFAPSESDFLAYVEEYADAHLLFLYRAGSKTWGAWDTDPKLLPHWKTAEDKRSPEPPEPDFTNWLREYRIADSAALTNSSKDFEKLSSGIGLGVGLGGGIGSGKTPCSSDDERGAGLLELTSPEAERTDLVKVWFDSEFWPVYPRKVSKPAALKAARSHGKTATDRAAIMECLRRRLPAIQAQLRADGDFRPYPASWLNQMPWIDPQEQDCGKGPANPEVARILAEQAAEKETNL